MAILSKIGEPIVTTTSLPGDPSDRQSRYIEAAIEGILIGCIYAPNGNPQPGPKFNYKLAWLDRLAEHAGNLIKDGVPAILVGDYNVVPTPFDIYPSKSWANDALVQPESRAAYKRILGQGLHPWTNGQVERMNRTIKEATVQRYHYDRHDQLEAHLAEFINAYNYARRLKTLKGLTPYEYICKCWTSQPEQFKLNPLQKMPGLNT